MYFNNAGKLHSMLVSWTDIAAVDYFTEVSAGKSWFRVDDLLELSSLIKTMKLSTHKV